MKNIKLGFSFIIVLGLFTNGCMENPPSLVESSNKDLPISKKQVREKSISISQSSYKDLPISKKQAVEVYKWLNKNFHKELVKATKDTPFSISLLSAIVAQESGYYLVKNHTMDYETNIILKNCILDATGDIHGTRKAFPINTLIFKSVYGNKLTNELIKESNRAKKFRHITSSSNYVYAGYGLFQYDLQYIKTDEKFFRNKEWYIFENIVEKVIKELSQKYKENKRNMRKTIISYNGSGKKAINYAKNVFFYNKVIEKECNNFCFNRIKY